MSESGEGEKPPLMTRRRFLGIAGLAVIANRVNAALGNPVGPHIENAANQVGSAANEASQAVKDTIKNTANTIIDADNEAFNNEMAPNLEAQKKYQESLKMRKISPANPTK